MSQIIMALDQGTSSSRTLLFDENAKPIATASQTFECHYPNAGWVEQDPMEVWESQAATMRQVLQKANLTSADITAIGITNQRETLIAWNRDTGQPLGPAIVWQCRRTTDLCDLLRKDIGEDVVRQKTGLVIDPYFSGTKMQWMLQNWPEAQSLANEGRLAFGTVDSWLVWNLTAGKSHVTDASNASRTLVYNIHDLCWDSELLEYFKIPESSLPKVVPSSGVVGYTDLETWGHAIPIAGIAGDQQSALLGQACVTSGMSKATYGTGCFILTNTGERPVASDNGLLTTVAWQLGNQTSYALEGSVFIAGALMQWLRDELQLFSDAAETEALATSVEDTGGVVVVPAFVGLGAPYWNPKARGTILGLTRDSGKAHIVRAALEAIAHQAHDVLSVMEQELETPIHELRVDGGAAANGFLCQRQADLLRQPVVRPDILESTARGAAFLAGMAVGVWKDLEFISTLWRGEHCFEAMASEDDTEKAIDRWKRAVSCIQHF